jgi:hypothetical protein
LKPVTVGTTFRTLILNVAEPPPGAGFEIKPLSVPGFCVSLALSENVIEFPETTP